jgi:predicted enzyme related to lactoylglutathione lyase
MTAIVTETFFAVPVADMVRAISFYRRAFGAELLYETPLWTSIRIAGVRIGLVSIADHRGRRTGLHFAVADLYGARRAVADAGGNADAPPQQPAPGVIVADVVDSEGNTLTLRSN